MLNYYRKVELSKYMSKLLRHEPQLLNLTLDSDGWIDLNEFFIKLKTNYYKKLELNDILDIVKNDSKQRYSIENDKIRANQGHNKNLNVDLTFENVIPQSILYHGTIDSFLDSILEKGLIPLTRQYVHLSGSYKIAKSVASRRKDNGNVVIIEIDTKKMILDGYKFYLSDNNVYLINEVPSKYFKYIIKL